LDDDGIHSTNSLIMFHSPSMWVESPGFLDRMGLVKGTDRIDTMFWIQTLLVMYLEVVFRQ
jgi:hypothetical protein